MEEVHSRQKVIKSDVASCTHFESLVDTKSLPQDLIPREQDDERRDPCEAIRRD
jgi:hypothetical protein